MYHIDLTGFMMPKLGLKCFLGSFLLSLAAVFVATKAYLVMSLNEQATEEQEVATVESRDIELFASNEDNDPLYDKFNRLKGTVSSGEISDTEESDVSAAKTSDIPLYSPEIESQETDEEAFIVADTNTVEEEQFSDDDAFIVAETDSAAPESLSVSESSADEEDTEELQIADAAQAPVFAIPLVHNFDTNTVDIAVSHESDESQIAMSSSSVAVGNLGLKNQAPVAKTSSSIGNAQDISADDLGSPWEVAKTSNSHTSKNSLNLLDENDQADTHTAKSGQETQVAYKMQKNLLIPIPEEIMNEKNLTPQLSSSAENKKLEDELRAKKTLPALNQPNSDSSDLQTDNRAKKSSGHISVDDDIPDLTSPTKSSTEEEQSSKSLSDSIAAWFSSSKPKTSQDNIRAVDKPSSSDSQSRSNIDQSNSIFNKLLGAKKNNVTPTELKLSFQPNRAEISGQTLEWLHAFADNAVKYENVVVEIRIDKAAPYELQQKRLRLLYRILANNNVDYNKINIIFTNREPNSFIIRNVRYATEEEQAKNVKTYNPWY